MTTTIASAAQTIEARLVAAFPTTVIKFPNAPRTPPAGQMWLQCHILWGQGMLLTMATTKRNAVIGVVHVDIYTPQQVGAGLARRTADTVRDTLNRVAVASGTGQDVRFDVPSGPKATRRETVEQQIWDVSSVTVPFTIEELAP